MGSRYFFVQSGEIKLIELHVNVGDSKYLSITERHLSYYPAPE